MACKVCLHPELEDLENELADGVSFNRVARKYCCSRYSVEYHAENCLPEKLKAQRFKILKKRLANQIARAEERIERQLKENGDKLVRIIAEDLLDALESGGKPHNPHS